MPSSNLEADEAKALTLFELEYSSLRTARPVLSAGLAKPAQRQELLKSATSAAEAAQLLRSRNRASATNDDEPLVEDAMDVDDALGDDSASRIVDAMPGTHGSGGADRMDAAHKRTAPLDPSTALVLRHKRRADNEPKPVWHAPWRLARVVAGHHGWVRSIAVDVTNEWFATGSSDRTIKIWDLASGALKLTLTGHISAVRGLAVSARHPYLFSVGEDKLVKCWDLEANKVIRHYHGHLSGIYSCSMHPQLDVLFTGGRDAVVRVWDMRTRQQVMCLEGHQSAVWDIKTQAVDPQVITGAGDAQVRTWDLAAGKCATILTHHKKAVRALALSASEFSFVSASPDNIKKWKLPEARFVQNFSGHDAIVNTMALNEDGVLISGADNGTIKMWDYKTGHCFQSMQTIVQPGSLEAEAGIFASTFDQSGSRWISCEADKTIKFWREDENATPETHPVVPAKKQ